jgi:hypothetical protein
MLRTILVYGAILAAGSLKETLGISERELEVLELLAAISRGRYRGLSLRPDTLRAGSGRRRR